MLEWFCLVPLISSLLGDCDSSESLAVGYVEGEYVLVAPIEIAQINTLTVKRGDKVSPLQTLAVLEKRDAEIAVAQSSAALAHATSQLSDSKLGKRPEEIKVIEAALRSANAQKNEAARVLLRQSDLAGRGLGTPASVDKATTALAVTKAKVAEMTATLAFARLPARADVIEAAEAVVLQSQATLEAAKWKLGQRTLVALRAGTVVDIIRNPGEIAGPQAPVLSILPEGGVKLRLYISQNNLHKVSTGTKLSVRCDGCEENTSATVNYVSNDPEYTPPVIYSLESRQKLVYLVEALPDGSGSALNPGQIVDVVLAN